MRRVAGAVLCLLLHACVSVNTAATREYPDSLTAATITVPSRPWVFARERPEIAANLRDYLTLYWAEVNRSGDRRTYLVAHAWSTVSEGSALPATGAQLDITADDRLFSLQALTAEPRSFGIGEPIVRARGRTERVWYYPIAPDAVTYLNTARALGVAMHAKDSTVRYQLWREPR